MKKNMNPDSKFSQAFHRSGQKDHDSAFKAMPHKSQGSVAKSVSDPVNVLERQQLKSLIKNVKTWREESHNEAEANVDKQVANEDIKSILATTKAFFNNSMDDNAKRLASPEIERAQRMLKEEKFSDALVVMLSALLNLYGINV